MASGQQEDVFSTRDTNQPGETGPKDQVVSEAQRSPVVNVSKFDVRSVALTGLFVLAIFYTMYFLRAVLLPLVLALLLSYLLRPVVRALARVRIPIWISSAVLLVGLLALIGYSASFLATPAAGWLEKAPYSLQ